jgi:aryl-alcohol dehydrogenase-like predicted oxidoreductase
MEALRAKSQELDRSMIQLALAWVLGQPAITTVLAGARSPDHVDQMFRAEAMGMSPELRAELCDM